MNKWELEALTQAIIVKLLIKKLYQSHILCMQIRNTAKKQISLYFNNYGAYHIPDRAVTTTEQRRSLTQYPPHPPGADTRGKRSYDPETCRKETTSTVSQTK